MMAVKNPLGIQMIPNIDVSPLFAAPNEQRDEVDRAILTAATRPGFMTVTAAPGLLPVEAATRAALLRVFTLDGAQRAPLLRRAFAPGNRALYRGWFPLQNGVGSYKEGIDIGPDVVDPSRADAACGADPLKEPTPLPAEVTLPGWRSTAARYYDAMQRLGALLMQSIARALGLPEHFFDAPFARGISTLRLIHYPPRTPESFGENTEALWLEHEGRRVYQLGAAHVDSGFVTLLAQDGIAGLQAEDALGRWIDVPPADASLAVNFGGLLERWTGARVRATRHRVIGFGAARYSIPFFYEPAADALIETLPLADAPHIMPFRYGDHLWSAMLRFPEFRGLDGVRIASGT
jgi:isopenicillin N synthase-like dioxygenase